MIGEERIVRSVTGPVAPDALGVTSMHEHLWMDSTALLAVHRYQTTAASAPWDATIAAEARWNPGVHPDNYRLTDVHAAVAELAPFVAAGGGAIVELTPPSLGRDVERVAEIATRAGITVVQGAGQYLGPTHEPWVGEATVATLIDRLVAEATEGVGMTGIRPGIFGEIGTSDPVQPEESRFLRAVAAASRTTGLAISVHLHPWGHEGPAVLDALRRDGAEPERIILGHLSTAIDRPGDLRRMADTGATLAFDLFGFDHSLLGPGRWPPADRDVAAAISALVADGYADRIVLGQDVGVRTRLRRWGGWGYAHLLEHVVPLLRDLGVGDQSLDRMMRGNPARLLSVPA